MLKQRATAPLLFAFAVMSGSVEALAEHPRDPWESFNRSMFRFNQTVDDYVLRPVAVAYRKVMPDLADRGVSNFFSNLRDVPTLANQILQLEHREAAQTATRLIFNSSFGLGGLIDVATLWELPQVREDFGQTLNHYGVPGGPYLMLPLLGPADVTDALGRIPDSYVDPVNYIDSPWDTVATVVEVIDRRADFIPAENLIQGDRYIFVRNAYFQNRDFRKNDGKVVDDPFLDEEIEDL